MVCCPEGGKHMAGGQKLHWNDVVSKDLKKKRAIMRLEADCKGPKRVEEFCKCIGSKI